jgi:hypothetical protein
MDELEMLRQYAARSDGLAPPLIDVADDVLATIRSRPIQTDWFGRAQRPLTVAAAASLLVAVSLGVFAQQLIAELQDPMVSLFTPLVVTLQ